MLTTYHLPVPLSWNLGTLNFWNPLCHSKPPWATPGPPGPLQAPWATPGPPGPLQAPLGHSRPVMGMLYLYFYKILKILQILYSATTYTDMTEAWGFLSVQAAIRFVVRINIFVTTRPSVGRRYVRISYTEFRPNETINEESRHTHLFTSLCEVWLSRCRIC